MLIIFDRKIIVMKKMRLIFEDFSSKFDFSNFVKNFSGNVKNVTAEIC